MKNIIYFGVKTGGLSVDVIEYLENKLNLKPKLLVGEFTNQELTRCKKKNYEFLQLTDAFLNKKKFKTTVPLNLKRFIKKYRKIYEPMCARFEFNKNNFNEKDINQYVNTAIINWNSIIKKKKIDLIIFLDSPHRIYDYITFLICKFYKIPTLFFRDPNFNGKMLMECDLESSPSGVAQKSKKNINLQKLKQNLQKINNVHFKKISKNKPYFNLEKIKKRLKNDHNIQSYEDISYSNFIINYLFGKLHPITKLPFKILKFKHEWRLAKGYEYLYWLLKATLKTLFLKIVYNYNSTNRLPKKYILFAMSYQPEATSYPDAGLFHNQHELILKISKTVKSNTTILVKEHPMQLNLLGAFNYKNPQIREINIYNKLKKNKNIIFLSQKYNMNEAIKNAEYTITVNGSVALQSVINGTPVLTFGHAWYVGCESIYKLKHVNNIKKYLNSKKLKVVNQNKLNNYISCLNKVGIFLWFKKFHKNIYPYNGITNIMNKENIKKIIKRDFKYFYKKNI